ncbi:MAG: capsule biosynthesis protein [Stenotrophobium sp.]
MSDPYKMPAILQENDIPQAGRRYLFLQGPIGPFFSRIAERLLESGHEVHHIAFNGGDRLFWTAGHSCDYTGGIQSWPSFLEQALLEHRITDIVLFGDCRPLHRIAVSIGETRGIGILVCEEGYLRPNWLTLERGGVNRHSSLSRDPAWYVAHAENLAPWHPGIPISGSFVRRALEDVLYRFFTLLLAWRYSGYQTHKPWSPLAEYWSGARRFFFTPLAKRRSAKLTTGILANPKFFYLLPLQLEADSQIRFHSSMGSMIPAIKQIIDSFAHHSPADSLLVVTEHPLDTGVVDLGRITKQYAAVTGVADRVIFMRGGSPEHLLRASQGVITVNSTLGILALDFNLPVKTLGHAIYDLPGLTFQGKLDQFWQQRTPPDRMIFDCFRRVVAAESQINGGLYSRDALTLAVNAAVRKLSEAAPIRPTVVTSTALSRLGELTLQSCK